MTWQSSFTAALLPVRAGVIWSELGCYSQVLLGLGGGVGALHPVVLVRNLLQQEDPVVLTCLFVGSF